MDKTVSCNLYLNSFIHSNLVFFLLHSCETSIFCLGLVLNLLCSESLFMVFFFQFLILVTFVHNCRLFINCCVYLSGSTFSCLSFIVFCLSQSVFCLSISVFCLAFAVFCLSANHCLTNISAMVHPLFLSPVTIFGGRKVA